MLPMNGPSEEKAGSCLIFLPWISSSFPLIHWSFQKHLFIGLWHDLGPTEDAEGRAQRSLAADVLSIHGGRQREVSRHLRRRTCPAPGAHCPQADVCTCRKVRGAFCPQVRFAGRVVLQCVASCNSCRHMVEQKVSIESCAYEGPRLPVAGQKPDKTP